MEVTVLSGDIDFIKHLAAASAQEYQGLTVEAPQRLPGHGETLAAVIAQIQSVPAGVAGSLIAAWLWSAFHRADNRPRAHLTLKGARRELTIEVEGLDEHVLAETINNAIIHVDTAP